uniref:PHD-type domain-containing protein n=1 Tax=Plectus sambesii TaxID=2011161 RepID=A0A914WUI1_9BILA
MPRNRELTDGSSNSELSDEDNIQEQSYVSQIVAEDFDDDEVDQRTVWQLKDLRKGEQLDLSKFTHGKMRAGLSFDHKRTCRLCGRNGKDKGDVVGALILPVKDYDFAIHELCIMLASQLPQDGDRGPLLGFRISKLLKEFNRGKKVKCSFCDKIGATVECCGSHCSVSFHVPCGREHGTFHIFSGQYQSFCANHVPDPPTLFERIPRVNLPFGFHLEVCSTICSICTTDRVMMKAVMGEVVRTTCCSRVNRRGIEEDVNRYYHFACIQVRHLEVV